MNLKRVFAGVAAAATMLGGLALGATTANAETIKIAPTGTITVNNAQTGHTYTPYRFATFSNAQTVDGKTYVDIDTVPTMVPTVRNAADAANGAAPIPTEYTNNPAAYVATFNAQQLRQFADKLTESLVGVALGRTPETDGENMSISNLATGWYAITDTFDNATVEGATAIVATPVNSTNTLVVNPKGDGQGNILVTGSYNAKSADAMAPTNVTKSVSDDDVYDGQQITYNVTATIPAAAAGYKFYGFQFADTTEQGLDVDTKSVRVVNGEEATVTPITVTRADNKLTVKIQNAKQYAGQTLTMTYNATPTFGTAVTPNTLSNTVQADAFLSQDAFDTGTADASSARATATVKTHDVTFTKVGVDGDAAGLEGAEFAIKNADGKYGRYANNTWTWATAEKAPLAATSDKNGEVSFPNIAAGTYTVEEIKAPAGYAQNLLPSFQITVGTKDTVTLDKAGTLGLASTVDKVIQVRNVKSVTQLPLTGAAGITMLVVVALLIGGAAALIAVRSRSLKRQLNA